MHEEKSIPTIFDIAREAGVSRGTVDRVIHNRGRFSEDTASKVHSAIKKLGYSVNPNAAVLASRKKYSIACLIPDFKKGEYWELIQQGLRAGAAGARQYNVDVKIFPYDQTDIESFRRCCASILSEKPSGILMNAVFRDEVTKFSKVLDGARIPYAFIDNKVDGLGNFLYIGIDPYKSGKLGAFLLTTRKAVESILLIRIIRDKGNQGDPNETRRRGFLDYFAKELPACTIHTVFINPNDTGSITAELESFFREHPHVRHIATTNSRIHLIAPYLEQHPDPERIVVGFDDTEKNLAALKAGQVEYLVTHRIHEQARLSIEMFADFLIRKIEPARRNHYVHLDILHRMNLDDYS